jgi:hypothetical protein
LDQILPLLHEKSKLDNTNFTAILEYPYMIKLKLDDEIIILGDKVIDKVYLKINELLYLEGYSVATLLRIYRKYSLKLFRRLESKTLNKILQIILLVFRIQAIYDSDYKIYQGKNKIIADIWELAKKENYTKYFKLKSINKILIPHGINCPYQFSLLIEGKMDLKINIQTLINNLDQFMILDKITFKIVRNMMVNTKNIIPSPIPKHSLNWVNRFKEVNNNYEIKQLFLVSRHYNKEFMGYSLFRHIQYLINLRKLISNNKYFLTIRTHPKEGALHSFLYSIIFFMIRNWRISKSHYLREMHKADLVLLYSSGLFSDAVNLNIPVVVINERIQEENYLNHYLSIVNMPSRLKNTIEYVFNNKNTINSKQKELYNKLFFS